MRGARWQARGAGLAAFAVFLALRIADPGPIAETRLRGFEVLQQAFPRASADLPVTIVDIDEASLAAFGQWPWPRTVLADLVRRLSGLGAAAIGFDVIFAEADRMSPARLSESLTGLGEAGRADLRLMPDNDAVFAEAVRGAPVVLGQSVVSEAADASPGPFRAPPVAKIGADPLPHLRHAAGVLRNLEPIDTAAAGHGLLTIEPEFDGRVQRVPLVMGVAGKLLPTLSIEMLRIATGGNAYAVRTDRAGITAVQVGGSIVPTDPRGRVWVRFAEPERHLYVSAKDVLDGRVDPARIRGKLVFVGTSATGLKDVKATPVSNAMPGVEIHAQLLETLLGRTFIHRPNWAIGAELVTLAIAGLALIVVVPWVPASVSLAAPVLLIGLLGGGSSYFFVRQSLLLDVSFPMVATAAIYTLLVYLSHSREQADRRRIRNAFSRYLSPTLVAQLAADPSRLQLGGAMRPMTVMFCDIRGFTGISERYKSDPPALTHLINRFLTAMTGVILDHQGTIDKYMGDCVMAFWNAPLDVPAHASRACEAALAMMRELEHLNETLAGEIDAKLRIGIGINTGDCFVGNMGADQRFDYSVLGDTVNLASRLESQCRDYGVSIILGEETVRQAPGLAALELDVVAVRGRSEPARIYGLLGGGDVAVSADFVRLRRGNADMHSALRGGAWAEAAANLDVCRELRPDLEPYFAIHRQRIAAAAAAPVAAGQIMLK
ncbi:MAG TPA: adenylate/guanylate cyclase domain-containing protein [Candidatus Cybelea sp.]|nr:adenylate/guanylate cyclase domain-containing protein [Candidatus Cybelea sp.]